MKKKKRISYTYRPATSTYEFTASELAAYAEALTAALDVPTENK